MSELDVAKEKIAYLKVWLGILVITDISTFGWLISNVDTATPPLLHRRIDRHIQSLRGL